MEEIRQLPVGERLRLIEKIRESIEKQPAPKTPDPGRWQAVVASALAAWGLSDLGGRTRRYEYVWARAFAAYELYMEACPLKVISSLLKRDRTDIIHLRHKMEVLVSMPNTDRTAFAVYERFKKTI